MPSISKNAIENSSDILKEALKLYIWIKPFGILNKAKLKNY